MKIFNSLMLAGLFVVAPSGAAEMDHSKMDHSAMQHNMQAMKPAAPGKLERLPKLPPSGKAREAGSDGRYAMESTSIDDDTWTQCVKASRGLVMVDNATWAKCGGKPEGWSKGPENAAPMDHSQHKM